MATTDVQAKLPEELTARARSFVDSGWAEDLDGLLSEALRRFLDSHAEQVTESMIQSDVEWGLHGRD